MKQVFIVLFCCLNIGLFAQIGNETGKYDKVIDIGYSILDNMKTGEVTSVVKSFKSSGMQSKKELKSVLCDSNMQWFSQVVATLGKADKSLIGISEMTTSRSENSSINLTYYFKSPDSEFSLTCDHVSLNFRNEGGEYVLDGLMLFRQEEYLMLKQFVDRL